MMFRLLQLANEDVAHLPDDWSRREWPYTAPRRSRRVHAGPSDQGASGSGRSGWHRSCRERAPSSSWPTQSLGESRNEFLICNYTAILSTSESSGTRCIMPTEPSSVGIMVSPKLRGSMALSVLRTDTEAEPRSTGTNARPPVVLAAIVVVVVSRSIVTLSASDAHATITPGIPALASVITDQPGLVKQSRVVSGLNPVGGTGARG